MEYIVCEEGIWCRDFFFRSNVVESAVPVLSQAGIVSSNPPRGHLVLITLAFQRLAKVCGGVQDWYSSEGHRDSLPDIPEVLYQAFGS